MRKPKKEWSNILINIYLPVHATVEPLKQQMASESDPRMEAPLCSDVGCNSSGELCRVQLERVTPPRCLAVANLSVAVCDWS